MLLTGLGVFDREDAVATVWLWRRFTHFLLVAAVRTSMWRRRPNRHVGPHWGHYSGVAFHQDRAAEEHTSREGDGPITDWAESREHSGRCCYATTEPGQRASRCRLQWWWWRDSGDSAEVSNDPGSGQHSTLLYAAWPQRAAPGAKYSTSVLHVWQL